MNVYTAILNGRELSHILNLPQEYINAEVEVKIRVVKRIPARKQSKFDSFFGVMKVDDIDEEIRNIRDDWKRL